MADTMDEIETRLGIIWKNILDIQDIAPTDDFFSLGGDSILVTIMAMKVEQTFNIVIDPGLIFDSPTLAEFAREIVNITDG